MLTSPLHLHGDQAAYGIRQRVADSYEMVRVGLQRSPLTATAVVAWSGDLPRHLPLPRASGTSLCRSTNGWGQP
jgi:hypothetical protein